MEESNMRPSIGQTEMSLPITFDYSGGRRDRLNSAKIWAIVLEFVTIFLTIYNLVQKDRNFLENIIIAGIVLYVGTFINRFFILKEGNFRREFLEIKRNSGKVDIKNIWGIYSISNKYPYICRFRNGKSGLIVLLNKDVVLGKYSEAEFEHHEAIADAYNIAGGSQIQMCHIDYMVNIGIDERLDNSFANLKNIDNSDIRDLLTDIYVYQKEQMMEMVTTYDAYVFMWRGSDINAWNTIQSILSCFLEANYRSYMVLDEDSIRNLALTIFNLNSFSAVDAMLNAFKQESEARVYPIMLRHSDGTIEKLGKTIEEKRKIAEEKKESKGKKKVKNTKREEGNIEKEETSKEDYFDLY